MLTGTELGAALDVAMKKKGVSQTALAAMIFGTCAWLATRGPEAIELAKEILKMVLAFAAGGAAGTERSQPRTATQINSLPTYAPREAADALGTRLKPA